MGLYNTMEFDIVGLYYGSFSICVLSIALWSVSMNVGVMSLGDQSLYWLVGTRSIKYSSGEFKSRLKGSWVY